MTFIGDATDAANTATESFAAAVKHVNKDGEFDFATNSEDMDSKLKPNLHEAENKIRDLFRALHYEDESPSGEELEKFGQSVVALYQEMTVWFSAMKTKAVEGGEYAIHKNLDTIFGDVKDITDMHPVLEAAKLMPDYTEDVDKLSRQVKVVQLLFGTGKAAIKAWEHEEASQYTPSDYNPSFFAQHASVWVDGFNAFTSHWSDVFKGKKRGLHWEDGQVWYDGGDESWL